jgi:sugar/nucleoside kinase (ribokinase family)
MRLALVGHVCIDHNTSEHTSYRGWGSAVMHMAHYFRNELQIDPLLVTDYGRDFEDHIRAFSVYPAAPNLEQTLIYENHSREDSRWQRCFAAGQSRPTSVDEELERALSQADIIVVAPLLPNYSLQYVRQLLLNRKEGSLAVLLPQGYFRAVGADGVVESRLFAEAEAIGSLFDLLVFSEEDCPNPEVLGRRWARCGDTQVIMTQGSQGASHITPIEVIRIPTIPVPDGKIVDSVGCGDVFTAAVAYHYFLTRNIETAIQSGHAAARRKLFQPNPALI